MKNTLMIAIIAAAAVVAFRGFEKPTFNVFNGKVVMNVYNVGCSKGVG